MDYEEELKQALKTLIQRFSLHANVENAKVISVDTGKDTCTVKTHSKEAVIADVKLTAIETSGNTKFCVYPKAGSDVTILYYPGQDAQAVVIKYSEIDDVKVKFTNEFIFNNGSNGGLVKVIDLVSKMNAIENKLNDFITKYDGHTHILAIVGTTGTAAVTVSLETPLTPLTIRADLENTKVKH